MSPHTDDGSLSPIEYHLLLAVAGEPMHGYAIGRAIGEESEGSLTPSAGSLYRVIARMMARGWMAETKPPADAAPHPGRERRYYELTPAGRQTLTEETDRRVRVADMARQRLRTS